MQRVLLIATAVGCLLLLMGAWVLARALTADPPLPAPAVVGRPPTPVVVRPDERPAPPVATAPLTPPSAVPAVPPVATAVQVVEPAPPAPVDLEFASDEAPALVEAWKQLSGEEAAGWRAAQSTFQRCLTQVPSHQRCKQGLLVAQSKLGREGDRRPLRRSDRRWHAGSPEDDEGQ